MKFTIISAPGVEIEVVKEYSVYAPRTAIYLVPDKMNFLDWAKNNYEIEKDRSEWIRKYENVLTGLKYWRSKAQEK